MADKFYDPLVWTAGKIAEEYGISVSDVLGLLLHANKDEILVRQALDEGKRSEIAEAEQKSGRSFDLVAYARTLLNNDAAQGDKH